MRSKTHSFGQNFLHHQPTIAKIISTVEQSRIFDAGALLEVGPGKLALTRPLAQVAHKHHIPLILVERDYTLQSFILEEMKKTGLPENIFNSNSFHLMDAATQKLRELITGIHKQTQKKVLFVSNLPYSASSQIIVQLCYSVPYLLDVVVMVQKELAERIAGRENSKDRGSLSLVVQNYFEPHLLFHVGPGAFSPPPKVQSTVIRLTPRQNRELPEAFEFFCKSLFSQRRKMIRSFFSKEDYFLFDELKLTGEERPENLSLETVITLFKRCQRRK